MSGTAASVVALWLMAQAAPQQPFPPHRPEERPDVRLPSGKSQRQEILKADFEKTLADAAALAEQAAALQEDIRKSQHHVLDVRTVKKVEDIEKLARRIKERLRRFY